MQKDLFIQKLEEKYGKWDYNSALFGSSNYGTIAEELCFSRSHFSKLISGSATDPMYERAIKNMERILEIDRLQAEVSNIKSAKSSADSSQKNKKLSFKQLASVLLIVLLLAIIGIQLFSSRSKQKHFPLISEILDNQEKPPYLPEDLVQDYCPCSAFEGKWGLAAAYTIPLPYKKRGLYYKAKSADIRMLCKMGVPDSLKGKMLLGFEVIHNEIWFDTSGESLSPKYFDEATKTFTKVFYELDFEGNPNFIKFADVHSFIYEELTIEGTQITRIGQPAGRITTARDETLLKQYNIDLDDITNEVIGDMVATRCAPIFNEYCTPNDLKESESTLRFPCKFSIATENRGLGGFYPYVKEIRLLEQQYASNLLCSCE